MKKFANTLLVVALFCSLSSICSADIPGEHPAYLHALSNLRFARFLLNREHPGSRDQAAIEEIDHAIHEIIKASIDDGKNLNDHPPADAAWDEHGRFRKALELLTVARADIAKNETNVFAEGLKGRALHHIGAARRIVHEIVESW